MSDDKIDRWYHGAAPKPAGPRIVDGWMELPGGGWVKPSSFIRHEAKPTDTSIERRWYDRKG